jgi:hypothetical protein
MKQGVKDILQLFSVVVSRHGPSNVSDVIWDSSTRTATKPSAFSQRHHARCLCRPLAGVDRVRFLCCLPVFDFLGHGVFLLFCPLFSRALKESVACSPGQGLLFVGIHETSLYRFVSWEDRKPGQQR